MARRGPPLAHRRPAQGHAPLHGADGDPRAHALRRRPSHGHVARVAQAAGLRRRADQPRGLWRRPLCSLLVLASRDARPCPTPSTRRANANPRDRRRGGGTARSWATTAAPSCVSRRPVCFLSFFFLRSPRRGPRAPPADRAPARRLDPAARRPTPRPHAGNRPRADPPGRARPARRAWPTASLPSRRAGLPREKYPRDAIDAPKTQADTWWQTETGVIQIAPTMAAGAGPHKPGAAMTPVAGCVPALLDATTGAEIPAVIGEEAKGLLVLKQPWPSMARTCFAASFVLCSSSRPRACAAVAFRAGVASWITGRPSAVVCVDTTSARRRRVRARGAWRYLLPRFALRGGRDHRARRGLLVDLLRCVAVQIRGRCRRRAGSRTRTSSYDGSLTACARRDADGQL